MAFNKARVLEEIQKYIQKGLIDKAIEEYERVLKIDPRDYKLRQKLGDLYLRKGKTNEAVNQYLQAAESYVKDGFLLKAIALYNQILRTDPTKLFIYEKLADLYKKEGMLGDAISKLRTLAEHYEKQKKLVEAMQTWEKIIDVDPDNVIYRGKIIEFYLKQGLATRAEEKLRQAIDYFKSKGRYEEVELLLSHFPGILEEDKTVALNLARSLYSQGKFKEALEKLELYLKGNPKDAEAYFLKGACYLGLNQFNIAKQCFEITLKMAPESTDAKKGLLKIYAKEKNWSQLLIVIEELYKIYAKSKKYDEIKNVLDNYYPYLPEEKRLLTLYIELFRTLGDTKALLDKLKKLANIYVNEGSIDEALRLFKEVLTYDPNDEVAINFIRRYEKKSSAGKELEKDVLQQAPIEELEGLEGDETLLERELEEVSNLLNFGLVPKAKAKLEELSSLFPDSVKVKEKWLEYYAVTKEEERYKTLLFELVDLFEKEGNVEKLQVYQEAVNRIRERKEKIVEEEKIVESVEREEQEEILMPEELEEVSEITVPNVDDLLIEADFYLKNNMSEEAIKVYEKVLEIDPQNEVAKERLGLLKKREEKVEEKREEEEQKEYYDLSSEILKELEKEEEYFIDASFKSEAEKMSFENLLKEFKDKIAREIEEGDVETHYNLGIAYKEMGLYDDAIQEFILVSRFPQKAYDSFVMVAACLTEKGEYLKAAEFYKRALKMPDLDKVKEAGIFLELGAIYEKLEQFEKAIFCYNKAYSLDKSLSIAKEKSNALVLEKPDLTSVLAKEDLEL